MRAGERPIGCVPWPVLALLAATLLAQISLHANIERPQAVAEALEPPPPRPAQLLMRGTEPVPCAYLTVINLQAFDNQPGFSIPFKDLDYTLVTAWLDAALALDPTSQYPLLMASQLYAQVPDRRRQKAMLEFVHTRFFADPARRWPWLAHAAIMAKHRLGDLRLALEYSRAIAERALDAPPWARQMHIFILEDLGEYDAARILLGGLLASNRVVDPHEKALLVERLEHLKSVESSSATAK